MTDTYTIPPDEEHDQAAQLLPLYGLERLDVAELDTFEAGELLIAHLENLAVLYGCLGEPYQ
jgi:hypothetical protein